MTDLERELIAMVKELTETAYLLMNDLVMQHEVVEVCDKAENLITKVTGEKWEYVFPELKLHPMPTDKIVKRYCYKCEKWPKVMGNIEFCPACNDPFAPAYMPIEEDEGE